MRMTGVARMTIWNKPGEKNFRFRFQPRFLTSTVDRDDLVALQVEQLERLKDRENSDYEMDEE